MANKKEGPLANKKEGRLAAALIPPVIDASMGNHVNAMAEMCGIDTHAVKRVILIKDHYIGSQVVGEVSITLHV